MAKTVEGMGRRKRTGGGEHDAYSGWRKVLCYLQRAGAVKSIKAETHRRERRVAKVEIRREAA